MLKISSVPSKLILYHQRYKLFANGSDKPYHIFNYFCRHPYYGDFASDMNTYIYQTTETIDNMIELTSEFDWNDLRDHFNLNTYNEYKIVEYVLTCGKYNGIFYDIPKCNETTSNNEYIFSRETVDHFLTCVDKVIVDDTIPHKEESGYYCS